MVKKATKKFNKRQLKSVLEHRKQTAKIKRSVREKDQRKQERREHAAGVREERAVVDAEIQQKRAVLAGDDDEGDEADENIVMGDGDGSDVDVSDVNVDVSKDEDSEDDAASYSEMDMESGDEDGEASGDADSNADDSDADDSDTVTAEDPSLLDEDALDQEIAAHKEELEKLREQDPEFFAYLNKNNRELLEFGEEAGDDEMEEEGDEEEVDVEQDEQDVEDDDEDAHDDAEEATAVLTIETLNRWKTAIKETNAVRPLKKLVAAFKSAVLSNKTDATDDERAAEQLMQIDDEAVYGAVIASAIGLVPMGLHGLLVVKKLPSTSAKWRKYQGTVKTYCRAVTDLLRQVTEKSMVEFVLRELEKSHAAVYFACFAEGKIGRDFVRVLLKLWSMAPANTTAALNTSGKDGQAAIIAAQKQQEAASMAVESTRIMAFLAIRRLATLSPAPFLESLLKQSYLTYVASARSCTPYTAPVLAFMTNCMIELHALDAATSYAHAFVYIRQLAILLRNALTQQTAETTRAALNWQMVACLRLWCRVLGHFCAVVGVEGGDSAAVTVAPTELHKLIFPLTQVALGIAKLIPTAQYYPLRFHVLRAVDDLARRTGTFIPLSPHLMDIVRTLATGQHKVKSGASSSGNGKGGSSAGLKPLDFAFHYRTPAQYLHTRVFIDGVVDQTFDLWLSHLAHLSASMSVAFPEMVVPVVANLKKVLKRCKVMRMSKAIAGLLEKVEETRLFVLKARAGVEFAPVDLERAMEFRLDNTPLANYVRNLRKIKERQAAQLRGGSSTSASSESKAAAAAAAAAANKRKQQKQNKEQHGGGKKQRQTQQARAVGR